MNETNSSEIQAAAAESQASDAGAEAQVAAAQAKAKENWDSYLRAVAEMENFRRRTERELDSARKFAVERFAQDLVPVADALEAAIGAASAATQGAYLEGVQATLRQLYRAFEKAGIKVIEPAGQPFDPEWHEAMVAQDSRDAAPDTVLSVVQKGYSINGRLLRPARVIVSRAPAVGAD